MKLRGIREYNVKGNVERGSSRPSEYNGQHQKIISRQRAKKFPCMNPDLGSAFIIVKSAI